MPTKAVSLRKKNACSGIFFENHGFLHEKTIFTVTKQKWDLARCQRANLMLKRPNPGLRPVGYTPGCDMVPFQGTNG